MNLRKRLPTALILLAVVFVCTQYLPRLGFFLVIQAIILASLFEFYNLPRKKRIYPKKTLGILFAALIGLSFYFKNIPLELALFVCLLLAALYYVPSISTLERLVDFPSSFALTFLGAFYLSFTLNYFNFLREEKGPLYIYFFLAVIFIGDTGAYFIGKLIGRHKLAPIASPKKTWEGSIGGLLFAALGAVLVQQVLLKEAVLWKAVLFALLFHAAAQISDPLESLFKRAVGVKDSSNMLPGHGGFLDRIDSLILATPFYYYLLKFIGIR